MSVEDNVRQKREELGITRPIIAKTLNLSVSGLDNKLYKDRKFTVEEIRKISILFNCTTDELIK